MKEDVGDLWSYPADAIVITTNGFVKKDGSAVMGRGCALEAKHRIDNLEFWLGEKINLYGNRIFIMWEALGHYNGDEGTEWYQDLITFPVKHNWWEEADLELIEANVDELRYQADETPDWKSIVMPRPGCGNGKKDWETEVRPILEPLLDDRFTVITYG